MTYMISTGWSPCSPMVRYGDWRQLRELAAETERLERLKQVGSGCWDVWAGFVAGKP